MNITNITNNNDVVQITIPVTNFDNLIDATGVTATQTIPTGISIYGTPVVSQGVYNTGTKIWTIGTLGAGDTATLTIKYKVDDITLQPFTIKTEVAITEPESSSTNNIRYDVLKLQGACVGCEVCDPCNFEEPTIVTVNDTAGFVFDLSANDNVSCACCQKDYEIVGSPVNITVNSLSNNGILNYTYQSIVDPGSLVYRVVCSNCVNGLDYTSTNASVVFPAMSVTATVAENYLVTTQIDDYTQDANYNYFRLDTASNQITFTLLPYTGWVSGKKIQVYVFDSSQSGALLNTVTIETGNVLDTFTETGTTTYPVITNNFTSLTIVYVGNNKFDVLW